ncbi:MAG: transposase family protein [Pirellula sp.]
MDTTLLRLLDGSRVYLHAVLDNYSRRILAWCVDSKFDPDSTARLLIEAADGLNDSQPKVFMDSGVENTNSAVTELVNKSILNLVRSTLNPRTQKSICTTR